MASIPELNKQLKIQKEIIDYCKLRGAIVFRMNAGSAKYNIKLAPKGTPDLLVVMESRSFWIEIKTPKGKVKPDQEKMHTDLREKGQRVYVCRSVEELIEVIE